ncbi:MAG: glycoside hydrolase family 9 protein [Spirochaetales bacterium]|nr:glycoside hydrolase family 9 protein [Spirochaetales bacterium]
MKKSFLFLGFLLCLIFISTTGLSAADLLGQNTFNDGKAYPWGTYMEPDAGARNEVVNQQLVMHITKAGSQNWGIQLRHREISLEQGHSYTVKFRITATANCQVYAKIGDADAPYSEYWNNNWTAFSLRPNVWTTVNESFTHTGDTVHGVELAFHMGGSYAGNPPYDIIFDDIYLDDPDFVDPDGEKAPIADVRVNQIGYFPEAPKLATVVNSSTSPLAWQLVNGNGQVVTSGMTRVFGHDSDSGDYVHQIDFSSYTIPGSNFHIELPNVASESNFSHPFSISNDIYSTLKYDAMAYFYHNRSGIEITMPYAGRSDLTRPAGHLPEIAATWPNTNQKNYTKDVTGGWYDAGDHGKYVVNGGVSVWTLMNLYERQVNVLGNTGPVNDGSMNIPEAGNSMSDLLDEIKWEMDFLLSMQITASEDSSKAGMVHHKIHDQNWTAIPTRPDQDTQTRYLAPPTTAATLNLAATAAQAYRVFADSDPAYAATCLSAAEKAWQAALANPSVYHQIINGGGGAYGDNNVTDEFYWAACELFISTGQSEYQNYLNQSTHYLTVPTQLGGKSCSFAFDWGTLNALGTISLALVPNNLPASEIAKAQTAITNAADKWLSYTQTQGYRFPFDSKGNYVWGSNSIIINLLLTMGLAHDFTQNQSYLEGMILGMDYILGRNAMDKSYVSGYGTRPLENPHHRFWAYQANPAYPKPPAGCLSGGPNSTADDPIASALLSSSTPVQKWYVDHIESYATNEITINWNAPLAWVGFYLDQHFKGNTGPTPTPTIEGAVINLLPASNRVSEGQTFPLNVQIVTENQLVGAYGFKIHFPDDLLSIDVTQITAGSNGFLSAANMASPGVVFVTGFDINGKGPGEVSLCELSFQSMVPTGNGEITLTVDSLVSEAAQNISVVTINKADFTISAGCKPGDINGDETVNIVDSLLIAQHYVGLIQLEENLECADVNCDNVVNIVDALLIAQYYVGILPNLDC